MRTVRTRRPLLALLLAAAGLSCSDGVGPDSFEGVAFQFSLEVPVAVSAAETSAIQAAFDQIESYIVTVVDSATGTTIVVDTIDVAPGSSQHDLTLDLPESTIGSVVVVTVIGFDGPAGSGLELYRAVSTITVEEGGSTTPVILPVRYTGPGVRGTVSDDAGVGLGGVTVGLLPTAATVATEPDGTYLFLNVSEGLYQVQPTLAEAFVCPAFRSVDVTTDASLVADFVVTDVTCAVDLLIISGGDVRFANDTTVVKAIFSITPDAFFFLNQTPGLSVLSQYDVVLLLMNGLFDGSSTLGDEIAAYVDLGGNVIFSSFYWQGRTPSAGSAGWGALEIVDPFTSVIDPVTGLGGATYQGNGLGSVTTNDPLTGDALTAGLTTLNSVTGYSAGVAARAETEVVATWADGTPLIGYRILPAGQRMVGVSLFPGATGSDVTGDVQELWENAVNWAGSAGGPVPMAVQSAGN